MDAERKRHDVCMAGPEAAREQRQKAVQHAQHARRAVYDALPLRAQQQR
jgi:hypothetical protein